MSIDPSALNPYERQIFEAMVEQKQMKESMGMFSRVLETCFTSCVTEFTTSALTPGEDKCVDRCIDKFMKHSERISQRFQEFNMLLEQRQMQSAAANL
ncbi:protein transporter tim9 [Blastocladiella emersonii ATCC 22665]|nr:protein transporter tim9 [Blastocladiella emersonii ATCC 22665]